MVVEYVGVDCMVSDCWLVLAGRQKECGALYVEILVDFGSVVEVWQVLGS